MRKGDRVEVLTGDTKGKIGYIKRVTSRKNYPIEVEFPCRYTNWYYERQLRRTEINNITEKHEQGYCGHDHNLEVIGVGRKSRFYNGYYCPKCKKVYLEDTIFAKPTRMFYSKKATIDHLKYIMLSCEQNS